MSWSIGKKIVSHYSQYLTKTVWSNNKPNKLPKQKSAGLSTLEEVLSAVWVEMENSLDCAQLSAWTKNCPFSSVSLSYKLVFCLFQGYYRSSNALSTQKYIKQYNLECPMQNLTEMAILQPSHFWNMVFFQIYLQILTVHLRSTEQAKAHVRSGRRPKHQMSASSFFEEVWAWLFW